MAAEGRLPDSLVAAIGGGSNAIGLFHPFLDDPPDRDLRRRGGRPRPRRACMRPRSRGGRPGVLHGNRTYLLMDDDGQIQDAHSISAGLDYPGIGPEHAWLHEVGRVTYISATDDEALAAFQLCCKLEGIVPALEPAHALAKVMELAPKKPKDHLMVRQPLGPRRQGHLRGGRASRRGPVTSRIEARFRKCRAEGRAALVTYVMAGDPDPETSLAILEGLPEAGADIVEFGLPFTDPMADGPAIQAAGLRALKAGQNTARTLDLVRRFRAGDAETPVILMGYFNPIYRLRRRPLPRRCQGRRRRRAHRRRPAARGGRRALPAGAAGRARLHPPRDADDRRPAAAGGAREHRRLRLLRVDHRHHRRGDAGFRQGRRRRWSASSATRPCRSWWASASRTAPMRPRSPKAPTGSWSARRWSRR